MPTPMQDVKTVEPSGESVQKLPYGVSFHDVVTHVDGRGSVVELYDPRWGWHKDPLVFAYSFMIRPGMVKGWAVHKKHDDRYFMLIGEMKVVLYDDRPESPTYRLVSEIFLSDYRRRLMNIPAGVWHADQNIGSADLVVVNFPTIQYDHDSPDKYRLPLDNDYIPYKFEGSHGW